MCKVCGKERYYNFSKHWQRPSDQDSDTFRSMDTGKCLSCDAVTVWKVWLTKDMSRVVREFCGQCGKVPYIDYIAEKFDV